MKIYLAGPLFTRAELDFNAVLAERLRGCGHEVFLPQEHEQRNARACDIFATDIGGIDWSDAIVANMDGSDPDSGTCWECGYGWAKGKRVVLFRTDSRDETPFGPFNLMMHQAANAVLDCKGLRVTEIATRINAALVYEELGK